jgi:hypothetical protein
MKLSLFRTVPLSILRSLFTVHSAVVYVIQVCRQLSSRTRMKFHYKEICYDARLQFWNSPCFAQFLCPSSGVYSPYTQQWYMSYRFVDSCRAGPGWSSIIKKLVTMHGYTNVKKATECEFEVKDTCDGICFPPALWLYLSIFEEQCGRGTPFSGFMDLSGRYLLEFLYRR